MKALIDPRVQIEVLVSWEVNPNPPPAPPQPYPKYLPVYANIENSARVCEVVQDIFPVSEPLFWVDCASDVVADQWYYDTQTEQIFQVPPPAPYPGTQGLQAV